MRFTATVLTVIVSMVGISVAAAHNTHLRGRIPTASNTKLHEWQMKNLRYMRYVCIRGAGAPKHYACRTAKWLGREASQTAPGVTLPPHYREWLCIHSYEGAWNDPGAPYYGGLQFASSTWERNGGLRYASSADQATPLQQMWIAESAWKESGGSFSQWPNTARRCGLI